MYAQCSPEGIRTQVRQVLRWIAGAEQDRDPGVKFLHASYAVGNLDILRQVASDQEIQAASGQHPLALLHRATALQDSARQALLNKV